MGILSETDLKKMGFLSLGHDVRISTKASIYSPENISIGDHVRIDDFCVLSGNIVLGSYIHIAVFSALFGGKEGIEIGNFANLSSRVSVYALSDDYSGETMTNPMIDDAYKNVEHGHVFIGRHCIIGTASTVMPYSVLEEGSAFGAYSFIKGNYPAWEIFAGIPATKIKKRSDNLLLLEKKMMEDLKNAQH